jgi:endogenous inhibitor of DNA gyrase (YacG/DUF329 family)
MEKMEIKSWMNIWKEWMQQSTRLNIMDFYDWLEKYYHAPQKKENVENDQQNESKCGL